MKTKILTLACALLTGAGAAAQTIYDAATIAQKDLNGTARFVGMGGAMGALGGHGRGDGCLGRRHLHHGDQSRRYRHLSQQ